MLKQIKVKYLLATTIAIFAMVGCGEILEKAEDRPTPPADEISPENKGRYLDENVSGIQYISKFGCEYVQQENSEESKEVCQRTIEGNTSADGTFGFIPGGEGVHFYVAGLFLDYIEPKYLVDNAVITVMENNPKLASFLQSMDSDGNASNGITIVPEVVQALADLNVSRYEYVNNSELNVATLVSQVQAKLDASSPSDETPDNNETTPHKLQKSSVALRFVSESEALEHLRATIAKYKTAPSITVEKVIEDIKDIVDNAKTYSEEEIQSKVKAVREQLNNPLEGDRGLVDIQVAQALVDLSELSNQTYLEDVFAFEGDVTNHLSQIIKEMAFDPSDPNRHTIVRGKEENSTNVIDVSKKATLGVVTNLKSISDKLGNALASVPQYYKFEYEDISIGIDNIATLRATLLAIASKMSLATAYDVGVDADYIPQTYKDTAGNRYEFTTAEANSDEMVNREGFGEAMDQTALTSSKRYLMESAMILKDLSASAIRADLNESQPIDLDQQQSQQEVIDYARNLFKVLNDNNGTFTITDENGGENGEREEITIAINRLFDINTAPKVSDFGTEFAYQECPTDFNITTEEEIKKYNDRFCYPKDLPNEHEKWSYRDYCRLDLYAKVQPTAETSSIDELITKIKVGNQIKEGEELIQYLDLNDSATRSSCSIPYYHYQPKFTYEKVAGRTYYMVLDGVEGADEGAIQEEFASLGTNTFKISEINATPEFDISFRIENDKIIVEAPDGFRTEDILWEEYVDGKYDRVQRWSYPSDGGEPSSIQFRAYYQKSDAEAYLGQLKNFKYIGSDTSILSAPNGGEHWIDGHNENITWDSGKIITNYVNLYVLHDNPDDLYLYDADATTMLNGKNWVKIENSDIDNSGSYQIDPADLGGTGNAYVILITDENNQSWDISDSTFSLNQ